jgi:hypothetical protein
MFIIFNMPPYFGCGVAGGAGVGDGAGAVVGAGAGAVVGAGAGLAQPTRTKALISTTADIIKNNFFIYVLLSKILMISTSS